MKQYESTTTRISDGLDLPAGGGQRQKHIGALIVAVEHGRKAPGLIKPINFLLPLSMTKNVFFVNLQIGISCWSTRNASGKIIRLSLA